MVSGRLISGLPVLAPGRRRLPSAVEFDVVGQDLVGSPEGGVIGTLFLPHRDPLTVRILAGLGKLHFVEVSLQAEAFVAEIFAVQIKKQTLEGIQKAPHPFLEEEDIRQSLQYAAWRVQEIEVPLPAA